MIIYPLLIIGLMTYKVEYTSNNQFQKKETNCLKGLLALLIFFHHISYKYSVFDSLPALSLILSDIGSSAVGGFFFISGFGLMISSKNENYPNKLLKRKIPQIYLLHVAINFLYIIVNISKGIQYKALTFITALMGIDACNDFVRANPNSWYITSIIIIYFIFALAKTISKKHKNNEKVFFTLFSLFTLIVFGLLLLIFNTYFNQVSLYIRAIYCLFLGMLYYYFFEKINNFVSKHFWTFLSLIFILLVISLDIQILYLEGDAVYTIIKEFILPILTVALIITLTQKVKFTNIVFDYLGKISLEIYLIHGLIQDILFSYISNSFLFTLTSLIAVIIIATIIHFIYNFFITYKKRTK